MLYLIHGNNEVSIRNFILKYGDNLNVPLKEYTLEKPFVLSELESSLQPDIFGESCLNAIDAGNLSKKNVEEFTSLLRNYPSAQTIIYSYKELEPAHHVIKAVSAMKGRISTISKLKGSIIFRFLDALLGLNSKKVFELLPDLLDSDSDPVYVITMIQYAIRNIALVKFGLRNKLSAFQATQYDRLSKNYNREEILRLFREMYQIERDLKTGKLIPDLAISTAITKILSH